MTSTTHRTIECIIRGRQHMHTDFFHHGSQEIWLFLIRKILSVNISNTIMQRKKSQEIIRVTVCNVSVTVSNGNVTLSNTGVTVSNISVILSNTRVTGDCNATEAISMLQTTVTLALPVAC